MDTTQAVFGFDVRAPFQLRTARVGGGIDQVTVETRDKNEPETGERILRWTPNEQNPLDASLSEHLRGGYVLTIADAGTYVIEPEERRISMPSTPDALLREARLLGLPLLLCFLARGEVSLHGAAVMGPSGAIILAAPGKHGKTSLAAALNRLGYRLLTEDLCCISAGEECALLPGPASLRVRRDMGDHILPIDGMEQIGVMDDRVVLAATEPGSGDPVPVAAIVLLRGFGDVVSMREMSPMRALPDLWLLSFHLPTEQDRARKFNQLVDLIDSAPVWELTQPDDPRQIHSTARTVVAALDQ